MNFDGEKHLKPDSKVNKVRLLKPIPGLPINTILYMFEEDVHYEDGNYNYFSDSNDIIKIDREIVVNSPEGFELISLYGPKYDKIIYNNDGIYEYSGLPYNGYVPGDVELKEDSFKLVNQHIELIEKLKTYTLNNPEGNGYSPEEFDNININRGVVDLYMLKYGDKDNTYHTLDDIINVVKKDYNGIVFTNDTPENNAKGIIK